MKILKGFGTGILSFLLFLSLSVFGLAFTLNSTLLNPDFVADEVDKIDAAALVRELTEEQIGEQIPEEASFLKEAVYDVIFQQEPWLKTQLNAAIYSGYDYLLGKSDRLNMVISLDPLKESLRDSLWQKFHDYMTSDLSDLPAELLKPFLDQHYEEFIGQIPKEYLPPDIAGLPEEQLKQYIDQNYQVFIEQIPVQQLPPQLIEQLEGQLRPYFDQYYKEYAGQIPAELVIDETSLPPDIMEQLSEARHYVGVFQDVYMYLIILMILLVAGIILINRNVRDITRSLGISLFIYGALELAGVYMARMFMPTALPLNDLPPSLQTWVAQLFRDLLAPLQMLSLILVVIGVVLLVVSFVYRRAVTED